jgi:hypothetical protein
VDLIFPINFHSIREGMNAGHLTKLGDGAGIVEFSKNPEAEILGAGSESSLSWVSQLLSPSGCFCPDSG